MWKPELLHEGSYVVAFNPFYHLIEIVRAPLLGSVPSLDSYLAVALITIIDIAIGFSFFARFRARISYWI
jgi:ABC-2 type transport system permease protein/lipopolysaccharide transport system permease protein